MADIKEFPTPDRHTGESAEGYGLDFMAYLKGEPQPANPVPGAQRATRYNAETTDSNRLRNPGYLDPRALAAQSPAVLAASVVDGAAEIERLKKKLTDAAAALKRHGVHHFVCHINAEGHGPSGAPCICGLNAALEATK